MSDESELSQQTATEISPEKWRDALSRLREALKASSDGTISTIALRRKLEKELGLSEEIARQLVVDIQFYDRNAESMKGLDAPDSKYFHEGRSFLSEKAWKDINRESDEKAKEEAERAGNLPETPT